MTQPYYQDDAVTIYNADCRDVLPTLDKVDLLLTDPPYGKRLNYGEKLMIQQIALRKTLGGLFHLKFH